MLKKKLGFTLMELLAVVLIISMLTSIALPKYQRTVERAASTEALVNLRSLFASAKRFRAANSQAPQRLRGLDVSFFDASTQEGDFALGKYDYTFSPDSISACRRTGNYCFVMYYNHPALGRDALTCLLSPAGGKYDWLCEALGEEDASLGANEFIIRG